MKRPITLLVSTFALIASGFAVHAQSQPKAAEQAMQTLDVKMSEWDIGMKNVTVGSRVQLNIVNDGKFPHAFSIEGTIGGKAFELSTPVLAAGQKSVMVVALPDGKYEVYCPVGNHEERGMKSTLTFKSK